MYVVRSRRADYRHDKQLYVLGFVRCGAVRVCTIVFVPVELCSTDVLFRSIAHAEIRVSALRQSPLSDLKFCAVYAENDPTCFTGLAYIQSGLSFSMQFVVAVVELESMGRAHA